jgi:hypothetical protein
MLALAIQFIRPKGIALSSLRNGQTTACGPVNGEKSINSQTFARPIQAKAETWANRPGIAHS